MIHLAKLRSMRSRGLVHGLGWSAVSQFSVMGLKLVSALLLTRWLAPTDYALMGTALTVLTLFEWLSDLGVVPILISHPQGGTSVWLATGWWINLARGAILTMFALLTAWPLAWIYNSPQLLPILGMLAFRPMLLALRSPGIPVLRRNLNYRALWFDELTQATTAAVIGLLAAAGGCGVWSLVYATLAAAVAGIIISYVIVPVNPQFHYDRSIAQHLTNLGFRILVNTLVMALWLNIGRLLGLKLLEPELAGLFFVAANLAAVIEVLITRATDIYLVCVSRQPVESRLSWHERISNRICLVGGPLLAFAVALAPTAVGVLYDPRYAPSGFLFAVMLARLGPRTVGQLDFQRLLASSAVSAATWAYVVGLTLEMVIVYPLTTAWGAGGLALAAAISTVFVTVVQIMMASDSREGYYRIIMITGWATLGLGIAWFLNP